jgi:hypothetical protein
MVVSAEVAGIRALSQSHLLVNNNASEGSFLHPKQPGLMEA